MYRCKIKVSGINNLTDARYFAAKGVDFIGFDVNPESEQFVPLNTIKEIMQWISGVRFVAECGAMDINAIIDTCNYLNIDSVEVHSGYNMDAFHNEPFTLFEKTVLTDEKTFEMIANNGRSAYTVLDCRLLDIDFGTILSNEWDEKLREVQESNNVFLDIKIDTDDLKNLLIQTQPFGIQIQHQSSVEQIGEADFEKLDIFFDILESD